jgi:DNA-binding SARP family transcriptional activator/tetratricopeptide (TPR) repeat protein
LVYLAVESRSGPVTRDTVLGVFWPDKPQDSARGSLNQALHYLRGSLGADAIRTHADGLEVDPSRVSCDAAEFLAACDGGRWEEAAGLYGGDLMPGHFDSGHSPDFEQWLDAMRERLRGAAATCAWKRAEEAEKADQATEAVFWARRACDWSMGPEAEARRLMEMMARLGDRAGVMQAYDSLVRSLEELEAAPAPATRQLLADLRARWAEEDRSPGPAGPREASRPGPSAEPTAPARAPPAPGPAPDPGAPAAGGGGSPRRVSWSGLPARAGSVAITLALMVVFLSPWGLTRVREPAAPHPTTVLIEAVGTHPTDAGVAGMLQGEVVRHLREESRLRVIADAPPEAVTRERGFVVRTALLRTGSDLSANVLVADADGGTVLASALLKEPSVDSPVMLDHLARSVAHFVRREVGMALEGRRVAEAPVPEAAVTLVQLGHQDMALGASLWEERSAGPALAAYHKADSVLAEAASRGPDWDLPWIGRAETAYRLLWIDMLSDAGSREAQREIVARGLRMADEAIARDDRQAESRELRALLLEWEWLLSQPDPTGRSGEILDRAEEEAQRATALDPFRARAWNVRGATLLHRGSWSDAYWALGRAVAANNDLKGDAEIRLRLFTAAWEAGNLLGAAKWCRLLGEESAPGWPAALCEILLMTDAPAPDLERLAELRRQAEAWPYWSSVAPQFDAAVAVVHARAGEPARAREILDRLPLASADTELPYLRAWALLELGEPEEARASLEQYVAAAPSLRSGLLRSRRFQRLAGAQ